MFFLYIGKTCCLTGYANKQFEFEYAFEYIYQLMFDMAVK